MATKKTNNPVPFSVMSGEGDSLFIGDKEYTVKPMLVGDALKFLESTISIDMQLYNLTAPRAKTKLAEYLTDYCTNESGTAMSIDKIIEDGWTLADLKMFMRKLCDISG